MNDICCHMKSFILITIFLISEGLNIPIHFLFLVKIKGRFHSSSETLLLNIYSYYTIFLHAPEKEYWLARIVPGLVWSIILFTFTEPVLRTKMGVYFTARQVKDHDKHLYGIWHIISKKDTLFMWDGVTSAHGRQSSRGRHSS